MISKWTVINNAWLQFGMIRGAGVALILVQSATAAVDAPTHASPPENQTLVGLTVEAELYEVQRTPNSLRALINGEPALANRMEREADTVLFLSSRHDVVGAMLREPDFVTSAYTVSDLTGQLGFQVASAEIEQDSVKIIRVGKGTPAERAGLTPGDLITHIADQPTSSRPTFDRVLIEQRNQDAAA